MIWLRRARVTWPARAKSACDRRRPDAKAWSKWMASAISRDSLGSWPAVGRGGAVPPRTSRAAAIHAGNVKRAAYRRRARRCFV